MFLYYANKEVDDIINCSPEIIKYRIKNISRNGRALCFKLHTRNVCTSQKDKMILMPLP